MTLPSEWAGDPAKRIGVVTGSCIGVRFVRLPAGNNGLQAYWAPCRRGSMPTGLHAEGVPHRLGCNKTGVPSSRVVARLDFTTR